MARVLVMVCALGALFAAGVMVVQGQDLLPDSFGCKASYLSDVNYCD